MRVVKLTQQEMLSRGWRPLWAHWNETDDPWYGGWEKTPDGGVGGVYCIPLHPIPSGRYRYARMEYTVVGNRPVRMRTVCSNHHDFQTPRPFRPVTDAEQAVIDAEYAAEYDE